MSSSAGEGLDLQDIEVFYQRHGQSVWYRCRRLLGDDEAAWDAMHQTYVRAIHYRNSYRGQGPVAWLWSIAWRVCLDEMKARKRRPILVDNPNEDSCGLPFGPNRVSIEAQLDQHRLLRRILPALNPRLQEIVVLRFFDELEIKEISERTGLSERTVARRLKQFQAQGKKLLERRRS